MQRKCRWWVGAVAFLVVGAAASAEDPAWSVAGKAVTADNCVIGCPCIFGEQPTHDACHFVAIFDVEEGEFGDLDLSGARFAMAGEFNRADHHGVQTYNFVAFYVDEGASEEQQQALRSILTGPSFAPLGQPIEFETVPISVEGFDAFGVVGATYGGTIGEIGRVEVSPITGARPGEPMVVNNSAEPLWHWTALGRASGSFYRSAGRDDVFEGTSGESHQFAFSGGGSD